MPNCITDNLAYIANSSIIQIQTVSFNHKISGILIRFRMLKYFFDNHFTLPVPFPVRCLRCGCEHRESAMNRNCILR